MARRWSAVALLLLLPASVLAFRKAEENDGVDSRFERYAEGFVGVYAEPTNFERQRIVPGAFNATSDIWRTAGGARFEGSITPTVATPRSQPEMPLDDPHGRQNCPEMVGPTNSMYFCRGAEYGYCDRRSGTCYCETGYAGVSCELCTAGYYRAVDGTHCLPRVLCANDCSGGGTCDFSSGTCTCEPHRIGNDCSRPRCSGFDSMCRECSATNCTRCVEGFHVAGGNACASCSSTHDPRCTVCNPERCLTCGDMLLLSVRRSGRRRGDPGLPLDERAREISIGVPFGTQRTEAFAEAEAFRVIGTGTSESRGQGSAELVSEARACAQGHDSIRLIGAMGGAIARTVCPRAFCRDARWQCWPAPPHVVSHRVCGHEGTLRWSSPTYAVDESAREVRLTVLRSGGGVGEVEVDYEIRLLERGWGGGSARLDAADAESSAAAKKALSAAGNPDSEASWPHTQRFAFGAATWDDLTATATYTGSQHLVFPDGVVSLSFVVAINDDRLSEGDERFEVVLLNPRGGVDIGPQRSTVVTILDDDDETGRFDPFSTGTKISLYALNEGVAGGGHGEYALSSSVNVSRTLRVQVTGADFLAEPLPASSVGGEQMLMRLVDRRGYNESAASATSWAPGFEGGSAAYGFRGAPLDSFDWHAVSRGAETTGVRAQARVGVLEVSTCNDALEAQCTNGGEGTFAAVRDCGLAIDRGTAPCDTSGSSYEGHIVPARAGEYFLEVLLLHEGGMRAEFFNNPWLLPPAVANRVDPAVDFRWGENRVTPHARDHVSARWHGRLNVRAKGGASYTFFVETAPADNCRLWIDRVLVIDRWNEPCVNASRAYPLRPYYFHEVTLEYRHHVGPASVALKFWSQQGGVCVEAPCVIQPGSTYSRMHYETHVRGSPHAVTVAPGAPSGAASVAAGLGLSNSTAGALTAFNVFVRDEGGNNREALASEDRVHMVATLVTPYFADGAAVRAVGGTLDGAVVARGVADGAESGDGTAMGGATHIAKYTPTVAGRYSLSVAVVAPPHSMGQFGNATTSAFPDVIDGLASAHIYGSPFVLDVVPGGTAARACDAFGGNLGVNSLGHGGDTVTNGAVGTATTFTIRARDEFRNPTARDGDAFEVAIFNAEKGTYTAGTVTHSGDGLYAVSVVPVSSGTSSIVATLNGVKVAGSPYTQLVLPGPTSGTYSTATGAGLHTAVAGFVASFTVQARDDQSNTRISGGDAVIVRVHPVVTNTSELVHDVVDGNCVDAADGTYVCSYTARGNGARLLQVLVDGEPIVGSRFALTVGDGLAAGRNTTASGNGLLGGVAGTVASFVVQMHDAFGNERDGLEANDAAAIHLDLLDGVGFTPAFGNNYTTTLLGSGRVRVDYTPTKIGAHPLRVVVNELISGSSRNPQADVSGSPFTVAISPGAPSGTMTQSTGDGTVTAIAGEPAHVFIHARDMFDNERVDGGDADLLRLNLRPQANAAGNGDFAGTIVDLQDSHGGYVATYTATVAGATWCNATLLQPGGLAAEYFSSDKPATTEGRYGYAAPLLSQVDAAIAFSSSGAAEEGSTTWPALASLGDGLTYSAVWTGVVRAQHSELYSFYLSTSDGARIWLDDTMLIAVRRARRTTCLSSLPTPRLTAHLPRRLPALYASILSQAWPLSSRRTSSASLRLNAGAFYNVRIEFRRDPRQRPILAGSDAPLLRLEWSSPSTKRETVPSAQLFHFATVDVGGTAVVDVRPAATSPPHSTVTGSGLAAAVAGVPTRVDLIAHDTFGNQRRGGNDTVRAVARRLNSSAGGALYVGNDAATFDASVMDNGDGSYALTYTAEAAGVYLFSITANSNTSLAGEVHADQGAGGVAESLRPFHVSGSPFVVHITDGATSPPASNCTPAAADGPLYRAVAGTESTFVLQLRDAYGNARAGVPADATVSVIAELDAAASAGSADNAAVAEALTAEVSASTLVSASTAGYSTLGSAIAVGNGQYMVRYTAAVAGVFRLRVKVAISPGGFGNGTMVDVEGSPFELAIAPAVPSAAHSVAFGPGLALARVFGVGVGGGPPSGTAFNFSVEVRDRFSNPRRTAASITDVVRVVLTGASGASILGAAHRFADGPSRGQWEVMYPPPSIGSHGAYRVDIEVVAEEDKGVLALSQWSDPYFGESGVAGGSRVVRVAAPLNATHAGGSPPAPATWVPLSAAWSGLLSPPAGLPFGDAAAVHIRLVVPSATTLTTARLTIGGTRVVDLEGNALAAASLSAEVNMIGGAPVPLELRVARSAPAPGGSVELAVGLEWAVPDLRLSRRAVPAAALHAGSSPIGASPFKMCALNATMDVADPDAAADLCATDVDATEAFGTIWTQGA
jgi:hypothetical protein